MNSARKGPYVIRSMSTTDLRGKEPVMPYHIYLKPALQRHRAFWTSSLFDRETYASIEEAQAEIARCNLDVAQIAPADDRGFPTYWDLQNVAEDARISLLIARANGGTK